MGCFSRIWTYAGLLVSMLFVCSVYGIWDDLRCGSTNLQFTVPPLKDTAFVYLAQDHTGKSHILHNSSACGTWVGQKPDGSLAIGAAYDGCYVREKDGEYVMTISLEEILNGHVQHHKYEIKCPAMPAMDAPSPSACSAIKREDRISCASTTVSRDLCERLGCCFTATDPAIPCYFGNPLTAQCTAANNVLVAISKEVTSPSLILDSVHVLGVDQTSCREFSISKTNSFIMFKFPLSCGGTKRVEEDSIIYENTIEATRDIRSWQGASITRDSTMKLTVRCTYASSAIVPLLKVEVFTLPPPLPVSTTGPLRLEMRIARDMQYASYYVDQDYPVVKVLRDPVYLEVRILGRTDPSLALILNDCWATPSSVPSQEPLWPILMARCPYTGDNYRTRLIPLSAPTQDVDLPTHYQRFAISTFTFVNERTQLSLGGLVYFHCSASVCIPSASDSCRTTCPARRRRMAEWVEDPKEVITSVGPIDFIGVEEKLKGADLDFSTLYWARGVAAMGAVLTVITIALGLVIRHRNQSPKMHTVNA